MKEYIAEVIQSEYGEAVVIKKELIRCKDCYWHKADICAVYDDDDDFYCANGMREEE